VQGIQLIAFERDLQAGTVCDLARPGEGALLGLARFTLNFTPRGLFGLLLGGGLREVAVFVGLFWWAILGLNQ
jgi:hypothetical protein